MKTCQHCTAKVFIRQGLLVSDHNGVETTEFCDPRNSPVRHKIMPKIEVSR